jgi:hypothetical protein
MALVKRGKTWHTRFFVDGQRFRQSLESMNREALHQAKDLDPRCEAPSTLAARGSKQEGSEDSRNGTL